MLTLVTGVVTKVVTGWVNLAEVVTGLVTPTEVVTGVVAPCTHNPRLSHLSG